ncbi:MAG: DNA-3-methyladenine glycosylase [Clostridium sp.]|uniref:DNA-3-methyladenine glycosylase n=1 Tax=Clostridium sp. TaxID=1506 RepID=UPI00302E1E72
MDLTPISPEFFKRDARIVSEELLGKLLVRNYSGNTLIGRIVETEAYIGTIDKACHAYGNKKTPRVMPLYEASGIAYVYIIYGMYNCMNVITGEKGDPQGVLIRAVEPIEGLEIMSENRFKKSFSQLKLKEVLNLTSGPGKLCIALNIDKTLNTHSIFSEELFISDDGFRKFDTIYAKRIGIDYAEDAIDFLWRYYIKDNKYVSILSKKAPLP